MQPATLQLPLFARLANAAWTASQRYWRFVVVAMLALLHVAVFRGVSDPWARGLLLAHLGLLLLWQPFLHAEQRVSPMQGLIIGALAVAVMTALNWWLLAFWVVVLAGLVGGKVYQHDVRWQRRCYLMVLVYLLALLAIVILPEIAPRREVDADIRRYAEIRAAGHLRDDRPAARRARGARRLAGDRLLLQRVPDAPARGGDPRQLHRHDPAPHRLPRGAHLHDVPHRRQRCC